MLLCHGWNIDAVNDEGDTALHLASRHGRAGVARRLAEAFPNEEIKNRRGFTALDEAIQAGRDGCSSCIRDFADFGKAEALEEHCRIERDRLEKVRRNKVRNCRVNIMATQQVRALVHQTTVCKSPVPNRKTPCSWLVRYSNVAKEVDTARWHGKS